MAKKKPLDLARKFGVVDGNVMSAFEVSDVFRAMLRAIEAMPRDQIVVALQEVGYEPEGGFPQASKEQLAKELLYKEVDGAKLVVMFGPGYSN